MANKPKVVSVIRQRRGHSYLTITVPLPRRELIDSIISIALLVGGAIGVGFAVIPGFTSPQSDTVQSLAPSETTGATNPTLPRSIPTQLEIPKLSLSTDLIQLGKNSDGTLETPSDYSQVGWYKYSPTPGELGPAIITGHVDSYQGPAVFFYLDTLAKGDEVYISREDGSRVTFQVDQVASFSQTDFPTEAVYGNIDHAGLRLITCGGVYNVLTGRYSHNTVVYATYKKT